MPLRFGSFHLKIVESYLIFIENAVTSRPVRSSTLTGIFITLPILATVSEMETFIVIAAGYDEECKKNIK